MVPSLLNVEDEAKHPSQNSISAGWLMRWKATPLQLTNSGLFWHKALLNLFNCEQNTVELMILLAGNNL